MCSRTTELRLLTAAVTAAALVPRLARRGLFLDGLTYATISRNLAAGRGSFWEPFYTATLYPAFHEHPPLGFWLQSLLFRALGDHWYVERIYCAIAATAIALLTAWTWRTAYRPLIPSLARDGRALDWLPVLLWIAAPVVSWTLVGNLLETTVSAFTSLSVGLLAAGTTGTARRAGTMGALSGLAVWGATLSKGPVGLFPMAAPLFIALLHDRRRAAQSAAAQWLAVGAGAAILAAYAPARASIDRYIHDQLLASLGGQREVSGHSFTILVALVPGVWLPMLAAASVLAVAAWSLPRPSLLDRRVALAFTMIGLAGSLPMLASPKQSGYYLMPAVPFLAVGAAALVRSSAERLCERIASARAERVVLAVAAAAIVVAIAAIGQPWVERDAERVAALDRIAPSMPRDTTVGICPAVNGDWGLHAWFARRFDVSLDPAATRHEWFIATSADAPNCLPRGCAVAGDANGPLVLMRCGMK